MTGLIDETRREIEVRTIELIPPAGLRRGPCGGLGGRRAGSITLIHSALLAVGGPWLSRVI